MTRSLPLWLFLPLFFLSPFVLFPSSPYAMAFPPSSSLDSLVQAGLDQAYLNCFEQSTQTFREIVSRNPEHPIGYLLEAGVLEMQMGNYDIDTYESQFSRLVRDATTLCDIALKKDPADAWAHFFKGTAGAYQAAFDARRGRYLPSLRSILRAKGELTEALAADSTISDAYLGLGVYDYYRTQATRFLTWLPFVSDTREKGIRQIKVAAECGRYVPTLARETLVRVLTEEGRFGEATALARELLSQYPRSLTFSWSYAEIFWRKKDWAGVEEAYRAILPLIVDHTPPAWGSIVYARHRLARASYERKLYAPCLEECRAIQALPLDAKTRKRLFKELQEIDVMRRRAEHRLR